MAAPILSNLELSISIANSISSEVGRIGAGFTSNYLSLNCDTLRAATVCIGKLSQTLTLENRM
ncbi:hypothetical protein DPMN_172392 [Dreissena polymorpha]|uniref:Uncharacterized protein n=1 Tax=Dreissena polymorpha TaxID=45954 RepID=A0A9D4E316_DREPO|nr:hypothetical protein DPMN_172392 [Dreissena polymorpha]